MRVDPLTQAVTEIVQNGQNAFVVCQQSFRLGALPRRPLPT
jgi:hypothetical protein